MLNLTGLSPDTLVEPDDDHDEHERFAVYLWVMDRPALQPLLLPCLADDPDPLMVSNVLAPLLEWVDPSQRHAVVNLTKGWPRDFAKTPTFVRQRAKDLDTLDALRVNDPGPAALRDLRQGSDWLQKRVVAEIASLRVMEVLEPHGRTRRVRGAAAEKYRRSRRTLEPS